MALPSLHEWAAAFDRLAPAMLSAAAGSVVLLGLAGLAVLMMRRASAAARHQVWLMGFAGVLLLPVLSATLPGWHVLPRPGARRQASAVAEAPFSASPQTSIMAPADSMDSAGSIVNTASGSLSAGSSNSAMPTAPVQMNPPVSPEPQLRPAEVAQSVSLPWKVWLLPCWAFGSLLVMCRVFLGHLSLWWLRRRCTGVTGGALFDLLERLRKELGLWRSVELLSSPARTMPMTWGLWRPRLLLPEQAAAWPLDQRRDVLLHELGHVKRWDCLTQLLSQVACALYWFNPLAWVGGRRMQIERERACDDLVLNSGAEAASYARHLLRSVSSVPALRLAGAAIAMARPSTLEERMRAILDGRLNRRGLTARGSLATVLLLLSALVPVAALKAQQGPAAEPRINSLPAPTTRPGRGSPSSRPFFAATRPSTNSQSGRSGFGGPRAGGRSFGGGFGGAAAPALGEGPTCTFDATLYDVRVPVEQIGKLDVDALAKASDTAEGFEKSLTALGATRPMYRVNQSVRLSGDTVTIGSEMPMITNTRTTDKGQTINTVQYQNVGAVFTVAGKAGAAGGIDLDLGIQLSSYSDTGTAITDKLKAPIMRMATLSRKGPVQPHKPFVVLSVDAGSVDKDGKAVAYIGRVTMGEPQPPAPK